MKGLTNLLALVVYALWLYALSLSLYPFTFDLLDSESFFRELSTFMQSGVSWNRFSLSGEFFCFMLSSYLLCNRHLIRYRSAKWIIPYGVSVIALHVLLGVGIEILQMFFPPRSVLLSDSICLSIGSTIGVVFAILGGALPFLLRLIGAENDSESASLIRILFVIWVGLVFYWSFFPFEFRPRQLGFFKERFADSLLTEFSIRDGCFNGLMGIPIGFFGALGLYGTRDCPRNALSMKVTDNLRFWFWPLLGGVVVAMVAEFGQLWFADRVPSLTDCGMQFIGCLGGVYIARNGSHQFLSTLEVGLERVGNAGWFERLRTIFVLTFGIASLSPFFPELIRADIKAKVMDILAPIRFSKSELVSMLEESRMDCVGVTFQSMLMTLAIISNRILIPSRNWRLMAVALLVNLSLLLEGAQLFLKERTTSIVLVAAAWIGGLIALSLYSLASLCGNVFVNQVRDKRENGLNLSSPRGEDLSIGNPDVISARITQGRRVGRAIHLFLLLMGLMLSIPAFVFVFLQSGAAVAFFTAHPHNPVHSSLAMAGFVAISGVAPWAVASCKASNFREAVSLGLVVFFTSLLFILLANAAIEQSTLSDIVGQNVGGWGHWSESGIRCLALFLPWLMFVSMGIKIGLSVDQPGSIMEWIAHVVFTVAACGLFYEVAVLNASTPYLLDVLRGNGRDSRLFFKMSFALMITGLVASLSLVRFQRYGQLLRLWAALLLPVFWIGQWLVGFGLLRQTVSVNNKGESMLNRVFSFDPRVTLDDQETFLRGVFLFACMTGASVVSGVVFQGVLKLGREIHVVFRDFRKAARDAFE